MSRSGVLLILVSAFAVPGCGKDFCARSAETAEACGEEVTDEDLDACRDSIAECTSDDIALLEDSLDCLEEAGLVAECGEDGTGDTEDLGALLACVLPLASLSPACQEYSGFETSDTDTGL